MTDETRAKYQALLESGAISRAEFDRVTADHLPEKTDASALPDAQQTGLADIRRKTGFCTAVTAASVMMLILSFVFIPRKPVFSEYDIGNAFLYLFGIGFWFLRAVIGCAVTCGLSKHARRLLRQAETGTNYGTDYRYAKRTLCIAAVLIAVLILHQIFRYFHPLGTP